MACVLTVLFSGNSRSATSRRSHLQPRLDSCVFSGRALASVFVLPSMLQTESSDTKLLNSERKASRLVYEDFAYLFQR
jgi:hypothetical protein